MQVPLLDLRMQYAPLEAEILDMLRELCASQLFILGRRVEEFETQLAAYCGTPAAVGVSSGSDALLAFHLFRDGGSDRQDRGETGVCRHRSGDVQHRSGKDRG